MFIDYAQANVSPLNNVINLHAGLPAQLIGAKQGWPS
jgi:hypothetical protein